MLHMEYVQKFVAGNGIEGVCLVQIYQYADKYTAIISERIGRRLLPRSKVIMPDDQWMYQDQTGPSVTNAIEYIAPLVTEHADIFYWVEHYPQRGPSYDKFWEATFDLVTFEKEVAKYSNQMTWGKPRWLHVNKKFVELLIGQEYHYPYADWKDVDET